MTTSWSLATRGRIADAVRVHAAGTLMAGIAIVSAGIALIAAIRGRWPVWRPDEKVIASAAIVVAGLVLLEWIVRLTI